MAELSPERFARVQAELEQWMDEQDGDLMVATLDTNTLLLAESDPRFDTEAQGFLRCCILVKRYDMKQGRGVEPGALDRIDAWMAERMPNGVHPDFPYAYLVEEPDVPDGIQRGWFARLFRRRERD